jgi:hypothetical protein
MWPGLFIVLRFFSRETDIPLDRACLIDLVVMSGKIQEEVKANDKGVSDWNSEITLKNHQPILLVVFLTSKVEHDLIIVE